MQIDGKTFLITGGASGLGLACARRLAGRGARVFIVDRDGQACASVTAELGPPARYAVVDVTSEADMQRAVDAAVVHSGSDGLRGLIHCAGIVVGESVLGKNGPHSLELFTRVVQVNLIGTFNASRLAAAAMARSNPDETGERGVIILTASISAMEGQIGQAAYAASKGGVASMTLPMARELARHGIRVVAIAPGVFKTPLIAALPDKVRDNLRQQTVFPPRPGDPDEFAALAEHIIENPMLNGSVLRLDGAVRMAAK